MNIFDDRRHNAAKHIAFIMLNVAIFRTHCTQEAYSPISSFAPSNEESSNFFLRLLNTSDEFARQYVDADGMRL